MEAKDTPMDESVGPDSGGMPISASDWIGRDDPDDPRNWSFAKRAYHSVIPTSFGLLCTFGSSVYTPGVMNVMSDFGVSREVALLPFVFYLLGLSFGPTIAAPVSETFGRKWVYLSGIPISGLFTLGAGFSQNISALTVCRFFAGFFSSPGLSIGTGTIADIWHPNERGFPMAAFVTSVQMGPALGPLIGGFVAERKGWRWTQWTMLFALVAVMLMTVGMSETYKKVILKKRARKLGIEGPPEPQRSAFEIARFFVTKTITRPMYMLCTETIVGLLDLYVAINFGLLNAFFAAFPWVFQKEYGFNLGSVGLTFLGQAVGSVAGFAIVYGFDKYFYQPRNQQWQQGEKTTRLPPEQRLWIAMVGAPMLPISLFWFGWTARPSIHWLSPVAAEAFFSCGNLLIFVCASLYMTDCYGALYGASAWSSNTFLRYLFATAFPLFALQMFEALGVGWASSLLGFLTVALMPIPFVFYKYGPSLRANSKFPSGE